MVDILIILLLFEMIILNQIIILKRGALLDSSKIKAFIYSVDCGSFTAAANELDYSPSGVSQLVRSLERELGLNLLTRQNKGVQPTAAGDILYSAARDYMHQEEVLYLLVNKLNKLECSYIHIGTYSSIASQLLPVLIREYCKRNPAIIFRIHEGSKKEVLTKLYHDEIDIAFTSSPDDASLAWLPVSDLEMVYVFPSTSGFRKTGSCSIEKIAGKPIIMPCYGEDSDAIDLFNKYDLTPEIRISTARDISAIGMIQEGLGVAVMNELSIRDCSLSVTAVPLSPQEYISVGLSLKSLTNTSPAVRSFMAFVADTRATLLLPK